jgi:hypothetical protein
MTSHTLAFLTVLLGMTAPLAHVAFSQTETAATATSTSPVAYVYFSGTTSKGANEIAAFAAAANGKLAPVPGSPFNTAGGGSMAVNGKYLFAIGGTDIDSYLMASNGSIKSVASFNALPYNPDGPSGTPYILFLDHTGATLYDVFGDGDNNPYQSFRINEATGQLTFIGVPGEDARVFDRPLSFIGDNKYGYYASAWIDGPAIYGYERNSSTGVLTRLNNNTPYPPAKASNIAYYPSWLVADPTNHLAVAFFPVPNAPGIVNGPTQLATMTVDSAGNLTTSSTYKNMPVTATTPTNNTINKMNMSPSGKLLAVAGPKGLQIFHFNGASPITHYTGLLTTTQIDELYWDNANHLYALAEAAKKMFVFTITPTSVSQASGSPHTVSTPTNLIVQPKTALH